MKRFLCVVLFFLVVACGGDKRLAPKEGRVSLSPEIKFTTSKTQEKLDSPQKLTEWTQVFGNSQNLLVHKQTGMGKNHEWTTKIGQKYLNKPEMPVVVHDGFIYAIDGGHTVSKLNLQDGEIIWQKKLTETDYKSVGVVFGTQNIFAISDQGNVTALSKDGEIIWQKDLNIPVRTTPAVNKNMLFVLSSKNIVVALNQKTGKEVWKYQTSAPSTLMRGMAHPAIYQSVLIVPFTTGEVIAFDANSGMIEWGQMMIGTQLNDLYELPHILASPVVNASTVYLAGNANLLGAYDARSGASKWTQNLGVLVTPIVSGNVLFVITKNHHLMALEARTGRIFWDIVMPHEKDTAWSSLYLNNNQLYASDTEKEYIVDPLTGNIEQTQSVSSFITYPISVGDTVIGVTDQAKVKLYRN